MKLLTSKPFPIYAQDDINARIWGLTHDYWIVFVTDGNSLTLWSSIGHASQDSAEEALASYLLAQAAGVEADDDA